jgi:NAD-dependent DNA ligase
MAADGHLHDLEIDALRTWLIASLGITENPLLDALHERINEVLADEIVDDEERLELLETLSELCGGKIEIGELLRSSRLPLCKPAPSVIFVGKEFCFTGTFVFGSRNECAKAVTDLGGQAGSLTKRTNFVVIGEYATDSWATSSYGRKIEKAVKLRSLGCPISIISEPHWRTARDGNADHLTAR